jgi:general secretion pathway protein F
MAAFRYTALDARGGHHKGLLEGDSAKTVRQELRSRGLHPVEVAPARTGPGGLSLRLGSGGSPALVRLLTQQLATLLRSGLPLEEALRAIAAQSESSELKALVLDLRSKILEGKSLSDALAGHPATFDQLYRATVGAGEASGKLDAVLNGLTSHLARRQRLSRKTSAAMVYPAVLTVVSILVVVGLLQFVVPEIVVVFQGTGQKLPGLTEGLIATSEFLQAYWPWILGIALAAFAGARIALSNPALKRRWHLALMRAPGLSRFIRGVETARLTRTLSILVGSGVALLESLRIATEVLGLIPNREALAEATQRVREGEALSRALEQSRRLPPITISLIASGEAAGNLAEMLENAAEEQETEIEAQTEILLSLFEPLLILVMGGAVLLIVLAMLLPIFEMNQLVG